MLNLEERPVTVRLSDVTLFADLAIPPNAKGIVIFCHGSGSSRRSPRNQAVARALQEHGFATLLFDLLTDEEDEIEKNRFDIPLLAARVTQVVDWSTRQRSIAGLPVGLFGASTGAAAALLAAASLNSPVQAVVSRGGRVDMAASHLGHVSAPTMLIVGELDDFVVGINLQARDLLPLTTPTRLEIVPGATHLFEEPGALDSVAAAANSWFSRYLLPKAQIQTL